jgi:hypothetical protein
MTELLIILSAGVVFFLMGIIPFNKLIFINSPKIIDNYLFNLLSSITLILFLNIIGLKLSITITIFYFLLICSIINFVNYYKLNKIIISSSILFIIFYGFVYFIIAVSLVNKPFLTWEAQTIWIEKAIPLVFDKTIISLKETPSPELPILFPIIWSFFWKFLGGSFEYIGRIFVLFLYLFSLILYTDLLKTSNIKKLIIYLILLLVTYRVQGLQGDLDTMIFSIILLSIRNLYIISYKTKPSKLNIFNFIFLINLLLWSSNEGMFLSSFFVIAILSLKYVDLNSKIIILISFVFLLALKLLIFIYYDFGINLNSDDYAFRNLILNLNFSNLILITKYLIFNLLRTELILIGIIFLIIEIIYLKKFDILNLYFIILSLIFIYCFFLFNGETLEGILKQKMIPLLYFMSAFITLPIINVTNQILKKSK